MQPMIELHPRADALRGLGLPAIPYPVALPAFKAAVANDGALPLADMLHGLQLRAAHANANHDRLEPAMARLAELLAADDGGDVTIAAGDHWWLEVGPVDLDGPVVTVQRGDSLLAALTPRSDGRLRVAAYRPLDARAAGLLLAFAAGNGWQRALDAAAGVGQRFAGIEGAAYIAYWEGGIGIGPDGSALPEWHAQRTLPARRAAHVAAELDTCHAFGLRATR
ncbi:hypothetical protein [Luteimonas sp. MC1572]|uniref:hypothetical protein n=1 Tax=Luteimonas sp. MC1572 TaxID=2799325 RepID=UPI0018F0B682|nr:hypothetical protein [Luteimonas sp. MC1572]MBJ6982759.1 hypothetical protein [Luteimonas sp. MC1572]QQO03995.1 hypothetical protein JGR64_04330 [Luteimonas sp. MC1572]